MNESVFTARIATLHSSCLKNLLSFSQSEVYSIFVYFYQLRIGYSHGQTSCLWTVDFSKERQVLIFVAECWQVHNSSCHNSTNHESKLAYRLLLKLYPRCSAGSVIFILTPRNGISILSDDLSWKHARHVSHFYWGDGTWRWFSVGTRVWYKVELRYTHSFI